MVGVTQEEMTEGSALLSRKLEELWGGRCSIPAFNKEERRKSPSCFFFNEHLVDGLLQNRDQSILLLGVTSPDC